MSAFMVSTDHIDVLVRAAANVGRKYGGTFSWYHDDAVHSLGETSYNDVGRMLLEENYRSLQARYPADPGDLPEYTFKRLVKLPDTVGVLKLISCYEYQTCEHDGWESSSAHAFCDCLRNSLIGELPGYAEAAWSI